ADVLLPRSGQDAENLAIRRDGEGRGGLISGVGRLPCVQGAAPAQARRLPPGGLQSVEAIHQQSTRRFGPDGAVKGQQKDLRIPEDMPPIVAPCEPPGANGDMGVAWIGGAVKM